MSLVRLLFKGVSEVVASQEVGLVTLANEDKSRELSFICDSAMVYQFGLRIKKAEITPKLAPEVLWQVISRNMKMMFQIIINDLVEGQYKALLYMPDILQAIPVRASDGILLAYITNMPVFIEDRLFMRQSVPYNDSNVGISVPVNVITNEMLQKALDKAVYDEDYEKASQIRDELKRRGGKEQTE
jgi:bifunctional DNase/RNase